MAEEKVEPREFQWRQLLPWTLIFQGFRVALDPNKLLLAAAGILCMSLGWYFLSWLFSHEKPDFPRQYPLINATDYGAEEGDLEEKKWQALWQGFAEDRKQWALLHEAAGAPGGDPKDGTYDEGDVAQSLAENRALRGEGVPELKTAAEIEAWVKQNRPAENQEAWTRGLKIRAGLLPSLIGQPRPAGRMRVMPWNEDRGPNPYLLVTGQASNQWERGGFWNWLLFRQFPVLVEPLVKLLLPVKYFFHPHAGFLMKLYCLLIILWTVLVWGLFGGAITRIAVVQVARGEKIGLVEALRFALRKYTSFVFAPIFPMIIVFGLLCLMVIFGLFHLIPGFGDIIVDGLFWPVPLLLGIAMAVVLIGLIGWPLMSATISAEGTDSWEAVSRSYSYVLQSPWQYLWYSLVALVYGAVVVFFVGLVGSLAVYLSKWGVSHTPAAQWANRDPSYLFVYAPESFDWRTLLLQDAYANGNPVVARGEIVPAAYNAYVNGIEGAGGLTWYNRIGAFLVSRVWVGLAFMLVLGFGYSFFWTATSIIYLLLRKQFDDAEFDEVYLEEEEAEATGLPGEPGTLPVPPSTVTLPTMAPPSEPSTPASGPSLPVVDPPLAADGPPTTVSLPPASQPHKPDNGNTGSAPPGAP